MSRIAAILVCLFAVPPATAAEPCPETASRFVLVFGADACGLMLPNRTHMVIGMRKENTIGN